VKYNRRIETEERKKKKEYTGWTILINPREYLEKEKFLKKILQTKVL